MSSKIVKINPNQNMTFADCGLDIEKNFLSVSLCDCGCGGKLQPILRTKEDIIDICGELVLDNDCMQCGVFAITRWNTIIGVINMDETVRIVECSNASDKCETIGEIAKKLGLYCYGLLVYVGDDTYTIVENKRENM